MILFAYNFMCSLLLYTIPVILGSVLLGAQSVIGVLVMVVVISFFDALVRAMK